MEHHDVSSNNLTGHVPSGFSTMLTLKHFKIANNKITGNIPNFSGLKLLSVLDVAKNNLVGPLLGYVSTLPLTHLYANDNGFNEAFWQPRNLKR